MNTKQLKAMLASYLRSILAGASALYLAGVTDPADLSWSLLSALIPVVLRAANPNDAAFGLMPSAEDVDKAAKSATAKKAPARKPVAKKKTTKK
jgi:hypothetical protein